MSAQHTEYMRKIDDSLSRAEFTARCDDGTVVNVKELHINVTFPDDEEVLFTILGNKTMYLGSARYIYNDTPYFSIINPENEEPSNDPYYNLNSIKIDDCYNGKGLGAILLYYSMECIFRNYPEINQIQLDDDSDLGTSNDPILRAKAIYQQYGFYRTDTVRKFIKTGTPIPNPNVTIGQEHFIPRKNVHGLVGWESKRVQLFSKVEAKLRAISSDAKSPSPTRSSARKRSPNSRHSASRSPIMTRSSARKRHINARNSSSRSPKSRKQKTSK
jgi:hypothetical protein